MPAPTAPERTGEPLSLQVPFQPTLPISGPDPNATPLRAPPPPSPVPDFPSAVHCADGKTPQAETPPGETPQPVTAAGPWRWFRFLAITESGYLLVETDAGIVTLNPIAARERIVYERLLDTRRVASQPLLIPETVQLGPMESARLKGFKDVLEAQGFSIEEFGRDVWKIDAVPQVTGGHSAADLLSTIAHDLAEAGGRRGGERWREELVARSVARAFAGAEARLTEEGAVRLVTELGACRTPYVCPRGRPVMIFTSLNELRRKFDR